MFNIPIRHEKTMTSISRDEMIAFVQRSARANGNRPLGERAFFADTCLNRRDLWDVGVRSYGDLCELAGYSRNRLQTQLEPNRLLEALAVLTAEIERYPDHTDREIARRKNNAFPSYEAYRTAQSKNGPLANQLLEWCRTRPAHAAAHRIVKEYVSRQDTAPASAHRRGKVVTGYVYLMRYGTRGRKYKIGKSEDPPRRHSQISGMVPQELSIVHVIETDDPIGIEKYWHQRFDEKLVTNKKEIFQLEPGDIAAFKRRKYQ
jgi:hypothetical protein